MLTRRPEFFCPDASPSHTPPKGNQDLKPPTPFSAHNVLLSDGSQTRPEGEDPWLEDWFSAARRCLSALFPAGFDGLRIADLGCLEGGFTVRFARLGFAEAVGFEVRPANFANCLYVKDRVDLPNLTFVNDDVWNLENHGAFDAVFCSGVLYHLDRPRAFLELLARAARRVAIIHTHYSTVAPIAAYNLSELAENEGLPGRWFEEPGSYSDNKWAAWGNPRSFWIQKEYLIEAIRNAGFPMVFEQFDQFGAQIAAEMTSPAPRVPHRGMFVGVKA